MKKKQVKISNTTSKKRSLNETEYLMSSEANRKALDESIQQINDGKVVKVALDDIWK